MQNQVESINVACAAAVVCYELLRRRLENRKDDE
jgi:tRNA G18 (ribose-2'-O)-methylase SpoU